jgi:myo-inositol-1(or 4)-monophosphatase
LGRNALAWRELLLESSDEVRRVVGQLQSRKERERVVGIGASGDETLLADREAERIIVGALSKVNGVRILSEEAGEVGNKNARFAAVVDPLDGSSNFERRIPFYCTSVAIAKGSRLADVRFGLVRNLVNGDVYYAEKGRGATKNGRRIATSTTSELREAVLAADLSRTDERTFSGLARTITSAQRQVHFGANALELCLLAEGMIDGFVDVRGKTRIVDFTAGYLIAKEAGALFSGKEGEKLAPKLEMRERFGFVASANPELHRRIMKALKS